MWLRLARRIGFRDDRISSGIETDALWLQEFPQLSAGSFG